MTTIADDLAGVFAPGMCRGDKLHECELCARKLAIVERARALEAAADALADALVCRKDWIEECDYCGAHWPPGEAAAHEPDCALARYEAARAVRQLRERAR